MKTIGVIGGVAPASTVDYYRLLVAAYRERSRDGTYPSILINSIDLTRMLDLIGRNRLEELIDWLLREVERLGELVRGEFRAYTRDRFLAIVDRLRQDGVEAVLLAGTELPLLLRDTADSSVPLLDTTHIHVSRAVAELLA